MRHILLPLMALLAACAGGSSPRQPTVWVPDGPTVNCINASQIRSFRVYDSRTVDFEMTGGRVYRNTLPFACPDLNFGAAIRHNARASQLCSVDSISVVSPGMRPVPQRCSLGAFQPMKRVPVPVLPESDS